MERLEMEGFRASAAEIAKDPAGNALALVERMESGVELDLASPLGDRMILRRVDDNYSVRYDGKVYVGKKEQAIAALTKFFEESSKTMAALADLMAGLGGGASGFPLPPTGLPN